MNDALEAGQVIADRYRLEALVGQGGFGAVWKATQTDIDRVVAIKFLMGGGGGYDAGRAARFLREVRVIANLQHPNTLTLLDFGKTETGLLYMVSEYLEGVDLGGVLRRDTTMPAGEVVHVLAQVLGSLQEAHALGVLHRDIKPDNVRLYAIQGDPLHVKLLDFGIAKSLSDTESRLTGTGKVVGTPWYMAPEQFLDQTLTPASDLYSVGLLAIDMLLGLQWRRARNPNPMRGVQIPPEVDLDPRLRDVVNRLVAFEIRDRFGTAAEAIAALRDVQRSLRGEPSGPLSATTAEALPVSVTTVVDVPVERTPPSTQLDNQRPAVGGVAVIVGIAAVALVAIVVWHSRSEPTRERPESRIENTGSRRAVQVSAATPPADAGARAHVADAASSDIDASGSSAGCSGLKAYPPGVQTLRVTRGLDREEVQVYLPPDYSPTQRYPLVWLFHGHQSTAASLLNGLDLESGETVGPFIVVAPQAGKMNAWSPRDFDSALAGFDLALELLCVDPNRIYAWGDGFGGIAVRKAMCMDSIAAVATSGYRERQPEQMCAATPPRPYLHLAASRDPIAPVEGGPGCHRNLIAPVLSLDDHEALFRQRNGCDGPKRKLPEVDHGECHTWDCEIPFESCLVDGGRQIPNTASGQWGCSSTAEPFPFVPHIFGFFARHSLAEP